MKTRLTSGSIVVACVLLCAWPVVGAEARYRIDPAASRFVAKVGSAGLFSFAGHDHTITLKDFGGEASMEFPPATPATLHMVIQAAAMEEANHSFSESDRKTIEDGIRNKVLEVEKYPTIDFKSTSVTIAKGGVDRIQVTISGNLSMHGVTRTVTVPAEVTASGSDLRAHGEFKIKHKDYNLKRLSGGGGTVKASETITLEFTIVAHRI